ncbi:MAG: acetate kinase [Minisyncoccia bacterium]
MKTLTVNIGSRSKKYALYSDGVEMWSVVIETKDNLISKDILHEAPDVIVFRVVAPGIYFRHHRIIDDVFLENLESAKPKAPLHIQPTLEEIKYFKNNFPHTKLVAISDSAFHAQLPDYARLYALPTSDAQAFEIERFGYHGISLSSIMETLKTKGKLPEKMIVCHLGGGSSVTAIKNGVSIDTSMGFSPLSGLPMATRVGDIDAGAIVYLSTVKGLQGDDLEEYLMSTCGFLGLAGTDDMKRLITEEKTNPQAALAIQMFVYQIQKYIGAYAVALGGLDLLVFSGGIGEPSEPIRSKIIAGLGDLGKNVLVVPTRESEEMVRLAEGV